MKPFMAPSKQEYKEARFMMTQNRTGNDSRSIQGNLKARVYTHAASHMRRPSMRSRSLIEGRVIEISIKSIFYFTHHPFMTWKGYES